jgi:hypothetical protein
VWAIGCSAIDDGPGGAKSAPPAINHEEKQTMPITSTTIAGNLIADILYAWVDPRIRYAKP